MKAHIRGVVSTAAILTLAAVGLTGCGSNPGSGDGQGEERPTIGISFEKGNAFREGQKKFFEAAAEELGVNIEIQIAQQDAQRQSSQITTLATQGVDGIAIIPWDPVAVASDIAALDTAGIAVTTLDVAPADVESVKYHVGSDPYADGQAAAAKFVELADGKPYKIVEMQGALNSDTGIARSSGLHDGLEGHDNVQIVSEVPTDWNPEPALAGIQNALQAHSDLAGIYLPTDGQIPAAYSALEAVGKKVKVGEPGHIAIVSIDGDENGCQGVRDGFVDLVLATDVPTMTFNSLQQTLNLINGDPVNKSPELLPSIPITPDDVEEHAAQVWGC